MFGPGRRFTATYITIRSMILPERLEPIKSHGPDRLLLSKLRTPDVWAIGMTISGPFLSPPAPAGLRPDESFFAHVPRAAHKMHSEIG